MERRYYLQGTNLVPSYTPPTLHGAWTSSGTITDLCLGRWKGGGIDSSGHNQAVTVSGSFAPGTVRARLRFISEPLRVETVFGGTATLGLGADANSFARTHLYAWISQGDSDTERGTLIDDVDVHTAYSSGATGGRVESGIAVESVTAQVGDRIIVEIGIVVSGGTSTNPDLYFGGQEITTDITQGGGTFAAKTQSFLSFDSLPTPDGAYEEGFIAYGKGTTMTRSVYSTGSTLYVSTITVTSLPGPTAVTYDGVALTKIYEEVGSFYRSQVWRLSTSASGWNNLVVTSATTMVWSSINLANIIPGNEVFTVAAGVASSTASVTGAAAEGWICVDWLGSDGGPEVYTPDTTETQLFSNSKEIADPQMAMGWNPGATSVTALWTMDFAAGHWQHVLMAVPPTAAVLQEAAQFFLEVFAGEDAEEPDDVVDCSGGGELASGTNPAAGTSLETATQPLTWMEVTLQGSPSTTYRWAKTSIPHGNPKSARVIEFGTVERALSDLEGRAEAGRISTTLQDIDGTVRALWASGTLKGALVDYYTATLATIKAGGTPFREFRGVIDECEPMSERRFQVHVEDLITHQLRSLDADDLQVPQQLVTSDISDLPATESMIDKAVPLIYGDVRWEFKYIGTYIFPGHEDLRALYTFLVGLGVIGVRSVEGASLGAAPTSRLPFAPGLYGATIFAPDHTGWLEANVWSERGGRRYTLIAGLPSSSAFKLAKQGTIPLVGDVCGYDTVGDRSGSPVASIDGPVRAYGHCFNNFFIQDATANWLPILTESGISLLDTVSIETAHTYLESLTYRIAGVIGHDFRQRSALEIEADFCRNFGFQVGINRHGQRIVVALDRTSGSAVASFTESHILEGTVEHRSLPVENVIRYVYDRNYLTNLPELAPVTGARLPFDANTGEWHSGEVKVQDSASITALGGAPRGIRRSQVQEFGLVRDETTATGVATFRRDLLSTPNGRLEPTFALRQLGVSPIELGNIVGAEHRDLPWTGSRRCQVQRHRKNLDTYIVSLGVRDVEDLLP